MSWRGVFLGLPLSRMPTIFQSLRDQRAAVADTFSRRADMLARPGSRAASCPYATEAGSKSLYDGERSVAVSSRVGEGSNHFSMEYMLAGLPIVSTPSTGGREVFFDHEFCTICEPHPNSVRDAV